ncbi:hypothetical protein CEP52_017856 [Fusarium oligoseptatum]|uniref:Uncharacterized protein n=1 Tax=Fusarium oligoseptatum TaxID=2604345 RepID=A0A428RCX0_9HYPO|nr:hypothetical protein CEP52_017856 [Fusarium oligoseptatum]
MFSICSATSCGILTRSKGIIEAYSRTPLGVPFPAKPTPSIQSCNEVLVYVTLEAIPTHSRKPWNKLPKTCAIHPYFPLCLPVSRCEAVVTTRISAHIGFEPGNKLTYNYSQRRQK